MYLNPLFRVLSSSKLTFRCCSHVHSKKLHTGKIDSDRISSSDSRNIRVFNSLTKQKDSVSVAPSRVLKWYVIINSDLHS